MIIYGLHAATALLIKVLQMGTDLRSIAVERLSQRRDDAVLTARIELLVQDTTSYPGHYLNAVDAALAGKMG